ncbi:hypothetical protein BJY04DRAFT_212257 [Aspergillus karnatakaensis]|uniref:class I SAM-dependent methyltransferase n=1 Tax=Aspergillus karnatakaensis TaxID=1810916 RepID=UPI003CCCE527
MVSDEGFVYEFDETVENRRLAGQHAIVKLGMGRLVLAPMDITRKDLRILDAATSDGFWLEEFASSLLYPETCDLVGTDITENRFPEKAKGIRLVVQSSLGPFPDSWTQSFDLVHQRFLLPGLPEGKKCVFALLNLVKPGGWVQLVEVEDNSGEPNGPQMSRFIAIQQMFWRCMGSDLSFRNGGLELWLKEAGFIRVGTMIAPVSLGAECPDPSLREQTVKSFCFTAIQFLLFYNRHNEESETDSTQVEKFIPLLARELRERGAYHRLRVVWAQRPL